MMDKNRLFQMEWQVTGTCRMAFIRKMTCDRNHKVFDRYGKVANAVFSYLCSC